MTTFPPSRPTYQLEELNHFFEYSQDVEELFEVREVTPPLLPRKAKQPPRPPAPRPGPFKRAWQKVKKSKRVVPLTPPPEEEEEDWNKYGELPGGRTGTFPRMKKHVREAELKDLRDQMMGEGKYKHNGINYHVTFEDVEPEPFVPKWYPPEESDDEDECGNPEDRKWEEFELPDSPEYASESNDTTKGKEPTSGYIPIDLSQIPPEMFGRDSNSSLDSTSQKGTTSDSKKCPPEPPKKAPAKEPIKVSNSLCDNCGKRFCAGTPIHVLTPAEVKKLLGPEIATKIVTELALRSKKPLPLPPRDPRENATSTLRLRDKTVVHTYATWASVFLFQKLILSIIRNIEKFKPKCDGAVQIDYDHYPVFKNIDLKSKALIAGELAAVWSEHVYILESRAPRDGTLRADWIGEPFWAKKQAYRMTTIGTYDGILMKYHIERGMPEAKKWRI